MGMVKKNKEKYAKQNPAALNDLSNENTIFFCET